MRNRPAGQQFTLRILLRLTHTKFSITRRSQWVATRLLRELFLPFRAGLLQRLGLGEALYFDGGFGAAANVFEPVLRSQELMTADARERVFHHRGGPRRLRATTRRIRDRATPGRDSPRAS